jgi:parallel beta-helix repeat protein
VVATLTSIALAIYGNNNQVYGNLIYGNRTGLRYTGDNQVVYNNTIFGNQSQGLSLLNGSGHIVKNNIIYGNGSDVVDEGVGGTADYGNNLCGTSATGCAIIADPQFIDPANRDFRLQSGSPAIDTGTSSIALGVTPSYNGSAPDIGAYEY